MNRKLIRRFATAILTAGLLGGVLIVPSVSAQPPNWNLAVTQDVVGGVSSGGYQGFELTISNNGTSNISSLYLLSDVTDKPVYISDSHCNTTGRLFCNFGALNGGAPAITLTVAYQVPFVSPAGNTINFYLNTTGNVPGKNNSHGDAFVNTQPVTVVSASSDLGGTFQIPTSGSTVQTNPSLTKNNPQSTRIDTPQTGRTFAVTAADGSGVSFTCVNCSSLKQFGQWSAVSVNNGNSIGAPFKVTLVVYSKSVPSNMTTFGVIHVLTDGTTEFITATCAATPPTDGAPCIVVNRAPGNGNLTVEVWLYQNGGLKNFGS